ncbi:hypothetical protein ASPZODRAFT_160618 [Penicilliopsis zonata CBS 506.65]|uniref:Uncharacterized protein n=1 Tax=Penicilliopsis zonata CBS 506.65 TaxID=1073090 RepID=A0A1L9SD81_9EURO|nr:hypothetical protein ASPZODRAFT_160618 [Penicilliopsis zonata CBS 506.65]OJJ45180.1 hypothetical protein ASPZODRAFT_160618 [Penicilliopsis zonata CBS 506.65]
MHLSVYLFLPFATASAISWSNCSSSLTPRLECASLSVPINWDDLSGPRTTIRLQRLPASNTSSRIGPLFYNPGGPGGVATEFINATAQGYHLFSDTLLQHFDLVGVDPRGVGTSDPIRCDPIIANERVTFFPSTEAEFATLVDYNRRLSESCSNLTGPLFEYMDTASVARDMEAVRQALGGEQISWFGQSYGSQMAVAHAELFPDTIRAMVLDGNVDHSQAESSNMLTESSTYERELERFANWCAVNATCALHGSDVLSVFDDLVRTADITPIPAPDCVVSETCRVNVTGEELRFNVQDFLTFKEPISIIGNIGWAGLAEALNQTLHGDASTLSSSLSTSEIDDTRFAGQAVLCQDWTHYTDTSFIDLADKQIMGKAISPHTQGASQTWTEVGCVGWTAPVRNPPHYASINASIPTLLVNAMYDPETSIVWANGLKAQIPGALLATRNGDGHTSYLLFGETSKATDEYLVSLSISQLMFSS